MAPLRYRSGSWTRAVDVFRTTDGGKTWTKVSVASPTYNSSEALPPGAEWLSFFDVSNGWATGSSPITQLIWLYITHDGGTTWQHQTLPQPAHGQHDIFTGPITFFNREDGILPTCLATNAGLATGADIYVTHNGGTTWKSTSFCRSRVVPLMHPLARQNLSIRTMDGC